MKNRDPRDRFLRQVLTTFQFSLISKKKEGIVFYSFQNSSCRLLRVIRIMTRTDPRLETVSLGIERQVHCVF